MNKYAKSKKGVFNFLKNMILSSAAKVVMRLRNFWYVFTTFVQHKVQIHATKV